MNIIDYYGIVRRCSECIPAGKWLLSHLMTYRIYSYTWNTSHGILPVYIECSSTHLHPSEALWCRPSQWIVFFGPGFTCFTSNPLDSYLLFIYIYIYSSCALKYKKKIRVPKCEILRTWSESLRHGKITWLNNLWFRV